MQPYVDIIRVYEKSYAEAIEYNNQQVIFYLNEEGIITKLIESLDVSMLENI